MPVRKCRSLLILVAAFSVISACGTQNSAQEPILPEIVSSTESEQNTVIPTTGGLCDNLFLPVKQGATWMYYSVGGPNGDFAYSDTISEVREDGFVLSSQFQTHTLTQEWACIPEGLQALQLGGGTTASISMQNMIAEFKTLKVAGISLPKVITPGLQWKYDISMEGSVAMPGEQTQSSGTFSLTMQEQGRESITVPAGTFEAEKLQATFTALIDVDFQGSPVPYAINGSSIIWYAPNIGYIKSIENIDFSGTTFTSTTELQTYNIP